MLHELKLFSIYYDDFLYNGKNFEVRRDDRPYEAGDYLWLRKWNGEIFTGEESLVKVRYIYRGEYCKDDYCIMAIETLDSWTVR